LLRPAYAATPSLPFPPTPSGHATAVAEPTLLFHSSLTFGRKSVKLNVLPEPTERRTAVMSSAGSFRPGFRSAMALSFQIFILPR